MACMMNNVVIAEYEELLNGNPDLPFQNGRLVVLSETSHCINTRNRKQIPDMHGLII